MTKLLHDTFMEVGSSIGIKKETNVSILETIGMFTILGTISFGTIKAYQYVQGTEHRSLENKLENLEERLEILNQKVDLNRNLIENNITLTSEEATIIKSGIKDTQSGVYATSIIIEKKVCESYNELKVDLINIRSNIEALIQNQNELNKEVQEKLKVLELNFNKKYEILLKKHEEMIKNESMTIDKTQLVELYRELQDLGINTNTNLNIVNETINTSSGSLIRRPFNTSIINSLPFTPEIKEQLNSHFNEAQSTLHPRPIIRSSSISMPIPPRPRPIESFEPNLSQLASNYHNKLYKLKIENNNFSFIESSQSLLGSSSQNLAVRTVSLAGDILYQTVKTLVGQALADTISIQAMLAVLRSIGIVRGPSTSEEAGRTVVRSIRDFINGVRNP